MEGNRLLMGRLFHMIQSTTRSGSETTPVQMRGIDETTGLATLIGRETLRGEKTCRATVHHLGVPWADHLSLVVHHPATWADHLMQVACLLATWAAHLMLAARHLATWVDNLTLAAPHLQHERTT